METIYINKEGTRYTYIDEDSFLKEVKYKDNIEQYCLKITEDKIVKIYDERLIMVGT
jgi:hypothetical protein